MLIVPRVFSHAYGSAYEHSAQGQAGSARKTNGTTTKLRNSHSLTCWKSTKHI